MARFSQGGSVRQSREPQGSACCSMGFPVAALCLPCELPVGQGNRRSACWKNPAENSPVPCAWLALPSVRSFDAARIPASLHLLDAPVRQAVPASHRCFHGAGLVARQAWVGTGPLGAVASSAWENPNRGPYKSLQTRVGELEPEPGAPGEAPSGGTENPLPGAPNSNPEKRHHSLGKRAEPTSESAGRPIRGPFQAGVPGGGVCGGAVGRPGPRVSMRSTALVTFRGTLGFLCLTCPSGWVNVAFPPFRSKAYY